MSQSHWGSLENSASLGFRFKLTWVHLASYFGGGLGVICVFLPVEQNSNMQGGCEHYRDNLSEVPSTDQLSNGSTVWWGRGLISQPGVWGRPVGGLGETRGWARGSGKFANGWDS